MSKVRSRSINIILKINLKIRSLFKGTSFPNHNLVNIYVCDRIISPPKSVIRRYCNEGHDVLTAPDMFPALKARPVKGCTAAVCEIDPAVKEIKANKIPNFSSFDNFLYEMNALRMWKASEVGSGILPWKLSSSYGCNSLFSFWSNKREFCSRTLL